jgi:tetratricopeptide (TPR) repeat protein
LALALGLIISFAPAATACLNENYPNERDLRGPSRARSITESLLRHQLSQPWPARRDSLREQLKSTNDYRIRNDLAVALLHTGETQEAIALLERIEGERPGGYRTASNLGTAYELAGENQKALEWIQKGAERNPDSHFGSEWIHLAILRAKIAGGPAKDVSVLGLDFNRDPMGFPSLPTTLPKDLKGEPLTASEVARAIRIQLHERLQFTEPPDPLVAELIAALATLTALGPDGLRGEGISELNELALKYDPTNKAALDNKIWFQVASSFRRSPFPEPKPGILHLIFAMLIGLFVSLRVVRLKRWIERRSDWDRGRSPFQRDYRV